MAVNQIQELKKDIKNEVDAQAFGLFTVFGLFTLAVILLASFIYLFSKDGNFSSGTKAVASSTMLLLAAVFIFNEKFKNLIFRAWLALLLIIFILFCLSCIGVILYVFYIEISKD